VTEIDTFADFATVWNAEQDALAFVDPHDYAELEQLGVVGRIVANDGRSLVLARQ